MRIISALAALFGSVTLMGCFGYRLNTLPDSAPLSQPAPISATGDFIHPASHYSFPAIVNGFNRVALLQYDTAGLDISGGYNVGTFTCPVAVTIYVSPTPRMSFIGADPALVRSVEEKWLDAAYAHWKQEITHEHPDAVLTSEDQKIQNGIPAEKAVYVISSNQSELFVFVIDQTWFLAYRNTYPAACSEQAHATLQAFFAQWPGRVR